MKKIGILFDLDGTLVDSLSDLTDVVNIVRQESGLAPLSMQSVRLHIGRGVEALVAGCFPEIPAEGFDQLIHRYREHYLDNPCPSGRLFPGVAETLHKLRQYPGILLGIVTNKPSLVADKTLAHYLPGFRFDYVAGPERVSEKKPSPKHLLETLAYLGLSPEEAWFVGDDPVDAQCAKAAGVRFLGAVYGIGRVEVPQAQRLGAFPEILKKIPLENGC